MRVALLSNVTVDLLGSMLEKSVDVYLSAGFDTWQQDLIMPTSAFYEFKPDAVVLLLHANSCQDTWDSIKKGEEVIGEWVGAISSLVSTLPEIPVFISSIDIFNCRCYFGSEIRLESFFESLFIQKLQDLHEMGAKIYILPVKETITDIGRDAFYSSKMWYMGSMPYSMKGLSAINSLVNRYINAINGKQKKCIAVDLDNTLWGGVIGEDGVSGIVLANSKEGARFKDAQRILKRMKEQGVMLAVLSKNNPEDVEPVFSHPDMVLKHDDFVAEIINWNPKYVNIKQMAHDLNIGLDSFVFLDDNPVEREQMKAACPEVEVVDFPRDSSSLPDVLTHVYNKFFFSLDITNEDTQKTAMYRAESKRKLEMNKSTSVEDYLKNLEMTMDIHFMTEAEEKRVTQLVNKTNQFNVTTKRYSGDEIHKIALDDNSRIITVHMADKYGEQGLVSVIILNFSRTEAYIDSFLMSCRVMGRNAEIEIISAVKEMLLRNGISIVKAAYYKTPKNSPVERLFESLGFDIIKASEMSKFYIAKVESLPTPTGVYKEVNCSL